MQDSPEYAELIAALKRRVLHEYRDEMSRKLNRHAATIRSFLGYAARHGLLGELRVALDRRREPADRTRALRDKTLWRLLYETAARASEALSLNVEDLDLPARRAVIRGKNGELDYVH